MCSQFASISGLGSPTNCKDPGFEIRLSVPFASQSRSLEKVFLCISICDLKGSAERSLNALEMACYLGYCSPSSVSSPTDIS